MIEAPYPQEHYIKLNGVSDFLVGRVVIFDQGFSYNVEIDIVQNESGKIHNHVKSLYNESDPREVLDLAVQYLKDFLDSKKQ